jgi:hypothetical protein
MQTALSDGTVSGNISAMLYQILTKAVTHENL